MFDHAYVGAAICLLLYGYFHHRPPLGYGAHYLVAVFGLVDTLEILARVAVVSLKTKLDRNQLNTLLQKHRA